MNDIITCANLQFEWIDTPEKWDKLEAFAATFNHNIVKHTLSPIVALKRHGRWIGYAQINKQPVVFSAWHTDPTICSPRDVVEGMKAFAGWAKIQHGGGFSAVPLDTISFLPSVMSRLGFRRTNCELYETLAN